ncbi:MAG: iron-containing alcohol dehydrogenase, partial [Planctomycetes bacterium]|nr:iron-containing alcohol dehydrogenase [Planctomycetota bacterium]
FTIITDETRHVKMAIVDKHVTPFLSVNDSSMMEGMPASLTAATGMDALTQLIEAFVSVRANPLTDGFCREGIPRIARSLRKACEDGECASAREDMALASLLSGLALANAGLGAAHGIAAPLGGMFAAPHGAVCAALLPHVITANAAALRRSEPEGEGLRRYDEVGRMLAGSDTASVTDAIRWTSELSRDLGIPKIGSYGVQATDIPALVEGALKSSSIKGNPITLTGEQVGEILATAM